MADCNLWLAEWLLLRLALCKLPVISCATMRILLFIVFMALVLPSAILICEPEDNIPFAFGFTACTALICILVAAWKSGE